MFNKMLVIVFLSTFILDMGRDPKNPVFQFVPISNTQCLEMGKVLVLELMSPELYTFCFMSGKKKRRGKNYINILSCRTYNIDNIVMLILVNSIDNNLIVFVVNNIQVFVA